MQTLWRTDFQQEWCSTEIHKGKAADAKGQQIFHLKIDLKFDQISFDLLKDQIILKWRAWLRAKQTQHYN